MAYRSGGFSRDGLNVRAAQSDNAQVSIEMGQGGYDLDSEIEGLRTDVGRLKQMSMAIGEENKLQKQAAETLSDYLEQADVALRRGMRRVNKALRQSKSNHLLYLALFCLGVFFMLYFLVRTYKLIAWRH
ncbi:g10755 [Coccomyxa viridis]|uniref:G10755 protein n=1 Tax=Coccomyxa viridis TaxID=1274662 RepID=A0ABP1GAY9_9CHLO